MVTLIEITRNVSAGLPNVAYNNPIEIYSITCIGFNFASILELGFVNTMALRRQKVRFAKLTGPQIWAAFKAFGRRSKAISVEPKAPTEDTSASIVTLVSSQVGSTCLYILYFT